MFIISFLLLFLMRSLAYLQIEGTIGNGINNISCFSAGQSHLTIVYGSVNDITLIDHIELYNISSNQSTTIFTSGAQPVLLKANQIKQTKTLNSYSNNTYALFNGNTTFVYKQNFTQLTFSIQDPLNIFPICLLPSNNWCYMQSTGNYTHYFVYNDFVLSSCQIHVLYDLVDSIFQSQSQRLYLLFTNYSSSYLDIVIGSNWTSYQSPIHKQYFNYSLVNAKVRASAYYYCIAVNNQATLYNTTTYNPICTITISAVIFDMQVTRKWIFISHSNQIMQYYSSNCTLSSSYSTNDVTNLQVYQTNSSEKLFVHYPNSTCIYSLISSTSPSPSPSSSLFLPFCYSPSPSPSTPIVCHFSCATCISSDVCKTCLSSRVLKDGNCILPQLTAAIFTTTNSITTFRSGSIQSMLFLLDGLDNYQYHKVKYSGIFGDIVDMMNQVESIKWSLIPNDFLINWSKQSFQTSIYDQYTNSVFFSIERRNALIYETVKAFYSISLPLNFFIFLLLNRLFTCIQGFTISKIIRIYSFWLQLLIIIFLSNSNKLSFYIAYYVQILFSFSTLFKFIHAISVFIIGFFLFFLISAFYFSLYLYKDLSKYFLINVYRANFSYAYCTLRYSIKPIIEAIFHVFLYNNHSLQLFMLGCLEATFLCLNLLIEYHSGLFKCKFTLMFESSLQFCMMSLNFLLYADYCLEIDSLTQNFVQIYIQQTCYVMIGIILFSLFHAIISIFIGLLVKRKNADDIWNFWVKSYHKTSKISIFSKKKNKKKSKGLQKNIRTVRFLQKNEMKVNKNSCSPLLVRENMKLKTEKTRIKVVSIKKTTKKEDAYRRQEKSVDMKSQRDKKIWYQSKIQEVKQRKQNKIGAKYKSKKGFVLKSSRQK